MGNILRANSLTIPWQTSSRPPIWTGSIPYYWKNLLGANRPRWTLDNPWQSLAQLNKDLKKHPLWKIDLEIRKWFLNNLSWWLLAKDYIAWWPYQLRILVIKWTYRTRNFLLERQNRYKKRASDKLKCVDTRLFILLISLRFSTFLNVAIRLLHQVVEWRKIKNTQECDVNSSRCRIH